jgi:hypothetical protein
MAFQVAARGNAGKAVVALSGSKHCDAECLRCSAEHPLLTNCPLHWPMEDRDITINRNASFSFKNSVLPGLSLEFDAKILCASIRMANLMVKFELL